LSYIPFQFGNIEVIKEVHILKSISLNSYVYNSRIWKEIYASSVDNPEKFSISSWNVQATQILADTLRTA